MHIAKPRALKSMMLGGILTAALATLLACAPAAPPAPAPTAVPPAPTATPTGAQVKLTANAVIGQPILTDVEGKILYMYTKDEKGKSNYTGANWPTFATTGAPWGGEGVKSELLSTFKREDGATQVVYNGWPLYYYKPDLKPGDMMGQNVGGIWYVMNGAGDVIRTAIDGKPLPVTYKVAPAGTLGPVLTTADGMTLSMFARDTKDVSACSRNCAATWPPLTVAAGSPVPGAGIDQWLMGSFKREDGTTQATYKGMPLYTYKPDLKAGDTTGQKVGDNWFVVKANGDVIK